MLTPLTPLDEHEILQHQIAGWERNLQRSIRKANPGAIVFCQEQIERLRKRLSVVAVAA